MMDKRAQYHTRRFDYAVYMLGKTGNQKYNRMANHIEHEAKEEGYEGEFARNSRGNNKMMRFKRVRNVRMERTLAVKHKRIVAHHKARRARSSSSFNPFGNVMKHAGRSWI